MHKSISRITFLLSLCALAACSTPPPKPDAIARGDYSYTRTRVSWLIENQMKAQGITGMSIALVDDQDIVWAQGFGFANKKTDRPATENTIYRAGSISKLFTAAAAMQLTEQGRLDIDRPLREYLPEFSIKSRFTDAAPITPRHLMTHHSGLPSDLLNGMWASPPAPFTEVVHEIAEEYAANPPDTVLSYSNVGVTLLGHAIQNVSGQEFAAHMQETLLQPMGMNDSYFANGLAAGPHVSKGYRNGQEEPEAPLRGIPAGGLNTNVLDLGRFMMMVFADGRAGSLTILQPTTLAETLKPQNEHVALDFDLRVGLGWFHSDTVKNGGPVLGHDGSTGKFNSSLLVLPEHKLGVVVLANSASAGGAVDLVATETLKLALEAKTGIAQPRSAKQAAETAPAADLSAFAGHYVTPLGLARVVDKGQHLDVEIDGETFQLVPRPDGRLRLSKRALGFIPLPLGRLGQAGFSRAVVDGREVLTARFDGKDTLLGEKIEPAPMSAAWRARTGEYEITNLHSAGFTPQRIELYYEDDFLIVAFDMAEYNDRAAIPIAPVSDTEAVILGLGRGKGETISVVATADGEAMRYSGFVLKKKQKGPNE